MPTCRMIALGGCVATLSGCHLVPSEDVRAFMTELRPPAGSPPDEAALAAEIRERTALTHFEFDETFDTGEAPLPPIFSHFVRLVAGE